MPMRHPMFRALLAVCLAWGGAVGTAGQGAPVAPAAMPARLPDAGDVLARHVAAIGGEAAYRAIKSVHVRGRFTLAAQGFTGAFELFSARPAKLLYRLTVPGVGVIENGYNGAIGWSLNPLAGPELLTGRQLAEAADDAWFDGPLHGPDHVRTAETLALDVFDGKPAYKLRVVLKSGFEEFEYYDVASGLQIGSEAQRATPNGVVPTTNILRDYKPFGAVLQATTFVQRALGFEQVVTVLTCDYDDVPEGTFDAPAEVRALVSR